MYILCKLDMTNCVMSIINVHNVKMMTVLYFKDIGSVLDLNQQNKAGTLSLLPLLSTFLSYLLQPGRCDEAQSKSGLSLPNQRQKQTAFTSVPVMVTVCTWLHKTTYFSFLLLTYFTFCLPEPSIRIFSYFDDSHQQIRVIIFKHERANVFE